MQSQLPDYLQVLNDNQLEAAQTLNGPVLIQAGAGSGKTKTVIARIHNLIDHQVPAINILAITFTNKAANELKERLPESCQNVTASTIHALCVKILRSFPHLPKYTSRFSIIDTDDQRKIMRMAKDEYLNNLNAQLEIAQTELSHIQDLNQKYVKQKNIESLANQISLIDAYKVKELLTYLPSYKAQIHELNMSDIQNHLPLSTTKSITIKLNNQDRKQNSNSRVTLTNFITYIMAYYQTYLYDHNLMDFDDLLYNTVELLTLRPDDLQILQQVYKYISVDEYQDVSDIQEQLIEMLANTPEQNLCVVGDPNQSIYAFRGAKVTNILTFAQRYPKAKIVSIMKNYRSTQQILDVANDVIDNNPAAYKIEAHLQAVKPDGDLPQIRYMNNAREEAQSIVQIMKDQMLNNQKQPKDFAVLYRLNSLSRNIESELTNNNIPYEVVGGQAFYDRAEIKDLIAYLRLIVNHGDDLAFTRIVNTPSRRIGTKTITLLDRYAKSTQPQQSIFNMALNVNQLLNDNGKPLTAKVRQSVDQFCAIINQFDLEQPGTTYNVLKVLMDQFFAEYLTKVDATEQSKDSSRLANANQLLEAAQEFDATQPKNQKLGITLANFIELAMLNANPQKQAPTPGGKVQLMTIHSSKGLEFDTVFIIGLENGMFPSGYAMTALRNAEKTTDEPILINKLSPEEQQRRQQYINSIKQSAKKLLEEERRLMYVALTRAKTHLYLYSVKQRMMWGHPQNNQPSLFLHEIKKDHCTIIRSKKPQNNYHNYYGNYYSNNTLF